MDQNLNLNVDSKTIGDCVKTVSNIGSDVYHNICNGSTSVVHWGTGDWMGNLALGLFIGAALVVSGMLIFVLWDTSRTKF